MCAAGLFAFAHPVVVVIMETGRFGVEDSERVAGLLTIFAVAVPAWILQQIVVRAFYARGQMWFPMALGTGIALAFIPLYQMLGTDAEGLAIAGAIGMATSALVTLALARVRHGGPSLGPLGSSALRSLLIAAVAAGIGGWAGGRFSSPLANLAFGGTVFAALCVVGVRWIGDAPLRDALTRAGFAETCVTAGDERGLANFLAFRRAAGGGSLAAWLLRRVRLADWTLGAGIVVTARKPGGGRT